VITQLAENDHQSLNNPVWQALSNTQAEFGELLGDAAIYDPLVSPFGGLRSVSDSAIDDLAGLCEPGRIVAIMHKSITFPDHQALELLESVQARQMIYTAGKITSDAKYSLMTPAHIQQMIELVTLTNPGPFGPRTIELGNYWGVMAENRLMAMAGERFKPPGWVEVSGVCTHPDAQGSGYAKELVKVLVSQINAKSLGAFLHVRVGSPAETIAAGVYQKIGFQYHQTMNIAVLRRR
jgi:predicted GNAT family acetyltransferase